MVRERFVTPGCEPLPGLPRGPHNLSRAAVERNQRARLLAATTVAVSEHGFAGLTVRHVVEQAGTSRPTFYARFENKLEAVMAAYDHAYARLREHIHAVCAPEVDWQANLREAIAAALRLAAAEPATAALITIHAAAVGEEGTQRVRESSEDLASLLAAGRSGGRLELADRAVVGAVWMTVATHLMAGEAERLPELAPRLATLSLLPYLSDLEAAGGGRSSRKPVC